MKIKICGIKSVDEAKSVCEARFNDMGVDYLGVIFAKSKRQVDKKTAKDISNLVHEFGIKIVGVCAEICDDKIMDLIEYCKLDVVQIYEKIEDKSKFNSQIWQVFSVLDVIPNLDGDYDLPIFDAFGDFKGGNGINFNWDLLLSLNIKFGLAGGIGIENCKQAIKFRPKLLDINSKVEDEFGIKIPQKIAEIIKIAKGKVK